MPDDKMIERIEEKGAGLADRGGLLMARDRFIVVFALIMTTIGLNAFLGEWIFGGELVGIALAMTLAVTLVTSESRRVTAWVALGFGVLTLGAGFWVIAFGQSIGPRFAFKVGLLGMTVILAFVIGKRIVQHPVVNLNTLAGAASIYLIFGLFFALAYSFLGGLLVESGYAAATPAQAFFTSSRPVTASDFMYFSFVTLTTVGYGDLIASTEFGRMLAISEALLGQLYLVTVVAVLVSNMGRRKGDATRSPA